MRSSVTGAIEKHPLDLEKLAEMKAFLKGKFPQHRCASKTT